MTRTLSVLRQAGGLLGLALAFVPCLPLDATGQSNTARITGTVTGEGNAPVPEVLVTARSTTTNLTRTARTNERGLYSLLGVPPDVYDITTQRIGLQPQTRRVRAQIGQTLTVDFTLASTAVTLATVAITGEDVRAAETRTPEQATNISTEQIENLPVNDRNFLRFAQLAPGVVQSRNRQSITTPGLSENNINIFVDGASYKNDVLNGGVAGQDASRGNPFPQSAVQEFRVITQQYKAEYQKATSVVVTATTKSGTNNWEGDAFYFAQTDELISRNYLERRNPNFTRPELGKDQWGGSVGGPLIPDRLFLFAAFEANHQDRASTVNTPSAANLALLPADVRNEIAGLSGSFGVPLRSNNGFAKLTYQPSERHRWEGSIIIRDEYEIRGFGGANTFEQAEDFNNDVYTGVLGHSYISGALLNEAHIDVQRYRWNPIPLNPGEVGRVYEGILNIGGRSTEQDFIQDRLVLRDDITYDVPDWNGAHIFKGGVSLNFSRYDVTKFLTGNPQFTFRAAENYEFPIRANIGFGEPRVKQNNTQVGIYVQDDWNITPRFLLSLGVRWDYESNMLNNDWVTPDSVRQQIAQFLTPEQQNRYFTDGDDRSPYYGMIQPRIGFSWEPTESGNTTIYGGVGIFYDRTNYNTGLDERYRLQFPTYVVRFSENGNPDPQGNPTVAWNDSFLSREGLLSVINSGNPAALPEVFLLDNELEPPKAYQGSIGVRQTIGGYRVSASYTGVRGHNRLTYYFGNRRANGSCCQNTQSFSNVLLADYSGRSWYDALYLTLERPLFGGRRWGGGIAYTLSKAETEVFDNFTLDILSPDDFRKSPDPTDERHRIVANFMVLAPWGIRFSGIGTFSSGRPFNARVNGDPNQNGIGGDDFRDGEARLNARPEKSWPYRVVDLRLEKNFNTFRGQEIGLVVEGFNVFGFNNIENYNETYGTFNVNTDQLTLNPDFGTPTGVVVDSSRRLQVGVRYRFQ
jgi:outer membrane receptor protein involved in Fe transport